MALHLAGGDDDIAALVLYSPNIEIFDPNAKLLDGPWGLQLAKMVKQSDYHEFEGNEEKQQYWTTKYRVEALTQLQALVESTMTEDTFKRVEQPIFMGYFYRNDSIQDKVVSVPAMLGMYQSLGTDESQKKEESLSRCRRSCNWFRNYFKGLGGCTLGDGGFFGGYTGHAAC